MRPNPHDDREDGTNTSDAVYQKIIDTLKEKYPGYKIVVYSQRDKNGQPQTFVNNVDEHVLDGSMEDTFRAMALADVLVTSRSSFSYSAGLLNRDGQVYYIPFWHSPLPDWISTETL